MARFGADLEGRLRDLKFGDMFSFRTLSLIGFKDSHFKVFGARDHINYIGLLGYVEPSGMSVKALSFPELPQAVN